MKRRIDISNCLMEAYKKIFPTLDFTMIEFYLDDTIDHVKHPGHAHHTFYRTEIYLHPDYYDPCSKSTFFMLMHELVHALQRQSLALLWQRTASSTCKFLHGTDPEDYVGDNCVEVEAYGFALKWEIELAGSPSAFPCSCVGSTDGSKAFFPIGNSAFDSLFPELTARMPGLVLEKAGCPATRCVKGGPFEQVYGYGVVVGATIAHAAGFFHAEGLAGLIGTIGGALGGAIGSVTLALGIGAGAVGLLVGLVGGALVGAFLGGFFGAVIDGLLAYVGGLFGGSPSGGSLNVVFSIDDGQTFGHKQTFERSCEQPSVAFRPPPDERLFISWTGTDDQLNVIRAPDLSKTTMERSDPSGPALAFGAGKLFIAWKGTDDHPNCLWSFDGKKFVAKFTSGGDGPRESNPGIAFGRDMVFLSWVGSDNHIRLIQLRATDPISEIPLPLDVHRLPFRTGHKGTPALAFGGGKLFVVWSGFEPPHLIHVLKLAVAEDGTVPPQVMTATPINDWTNDTTGPATAFHAPGNRLYVAFTGADDRLYVISSTDDGASFPNRVILPAELSRHDAGPAIAVHSDGTVCVCWTGTDGD